MNDGQQRSRDQQRIAEAMPAGWTEEPRLTEVKGYGGCSVRRAAYAKEKEIRVVPLVRIWKLES